MRISSVTISLISAPLKIPFLTHLEKVTKREAIVIEVRDSDGRIGYGEAVPFSSPWYTEETIKTCWHILGDFLIPLVLSQPIQHPKELVSLWAGIRRNSMAKSGLSQAIWDLYAKQEEVYLGQLFGGVRKTVAAGVVIAADDVRKALKQIDEFATIGYQRYKIKIQRSTDISVLSEIRRHFPDIPLMADANSSYSLLDMEHLKKLDEFNLQMIEQPLGHDDLMEHAILQKEIKTPICLDESICSFHDAKQALMLGSGKVISIKMSRVGGWAEAVNIHNLCVENEIPVWCGGMIEFGISKAHNIALASLHGFTIPGDLSSSSRYWEQDIVDPEIVVKNGNITVPDGVGIGFEVDEHRLQSMMIHQQLFKV
ncbi:o-succinylbenzoate synthase [Peribacillus huizhouensis]|uniref:o-succinylbenzoate synthase n=1 Tax=Peribacillus huizhouensis TaxID=1501239 RepID=A0ABR6CVJ2_9BACI|nr:o-succinylbenzoate synthase [Peribacillus huizhouensis]MBA9029047.1 O-succinylbenzoate synthase [Peribacillus huizhouensis]